MTIPEICAVSALAVDVIRLIIDILKYRSDNTNNQLTYRQILGWNKPIRRQAPLPGGKPACSRFPRLVLFHLSALSIEQLVISIKKTDRPSCSLNGQIV